MENVNLIVLVGMPGAGKSFCVDYLKAKGWPSVYFGGIILAELEVRGLAVNPDNEKMVREDIRAKEGKDVYARRIIAQIEGLVADGQNTIIVDGLYSWSEYKVFKERFGDRACIIAISAPRKLRHARLANRPVRPLTSQEVTAREYAEIENIEKGGPIANADYTIGNEGSTEQLITDLELVLAQLKLPS